MMATRMETEPIPAARRSSAVRVWLAVSARRFETSVSHMRVPENHAR